MGLGCLPSCLPMQRLSISYNLDSVKHFTLPKAISVIRVVPASAPPDAVTYGLLISTVLLHVHPRQLGQPGLLLSEYARSND